MWRVIVAGASVLLLGLLCLIPVVATLGPCASGGQSALLLIGLGILGLGAFITVVGIILWIVQLIGERVEGST
jgi:hypothetical protein